MKRGTDGKHRKTQVRITIKIKERIKIMMIFGFIFAICCAAFAEAVNVNNKINLTK